MPRSVIAHVSLFAMLLHLAWGHCAYHLPACKEHSHHHAGHSHSHDPADKTSDEPLHADCHDSHASAVVSRPVVAPQTDGAGVPTQPPADLTALHAAIAARVDPIFRSDQQGPLPLRALSRTQVLLN